MTEHTVDLVIHGGRVVHPDGVVEANIAVNDGRITAIGDEAVLPRAEKALDAAGMYVLPGAIDSHVHFREPGHAYKENWRSGTAAAACGGVTTVLEMPNTHPPTASVEALAQKLELARRQAHVDFGVYALLDEHNIDELTALGSKGAAAFKCYMGNTFGEVMAPSDGAMLEGFEVLARLGLRCAVHAENASILARRQKRVEGAGRTDPLAHPAVRPEVCEGEAVGRAIAFAEWTGARLHIAHVSTRDAVPLIRDAKARGVDVTAETCPHYLLLSTDDMAHLGGVMRINPPVREPGHAEALWQALDDGTIDMIATDHAPHQPEEKTSPNIWQCQCGFPGVETQMRLMLTEVDRGRMAITDYVRWVAANPARAWGLYPRKGVLQPGADADIVVVDMERRETIDQDRLHSLSRISPWHGRPVKGAPVHTIVRGGIVVEDGVLVGPPGWGIPVRQEMPPPRPRNLEKTIAAVTAPR
ncbi:MAG: allantoinase AllB [Alphaproteobacteria bacterium]